MGITGITKVTQCAHVSVKTFCWIENLPGKAPSFVYGGFPTNGLCILSKNEIVVLCQTCSRNHDVLKYVPDFGVPLLKPTRLD